MRIKFWIFDSSFGSNRCISINCDEPLTGKKSTSWKKGGKYVGKMLTLLQIMISYLHLSAKTFPFNAKVCMSR